LKAVEILASSEKNFERQVYTYWEICNYFMYFFSGNRENDFLTFSGLFKNPWAGFEYP